MAMLEHLDHAQILPPPSRTYEKRKERTIGDMGAILKAQSLYGPGIPAPANGPVKGPTAGQMDKGTVANSNIGGSWGKPKE